MEKGWALLPAAADSLRVRGGDPLGALQRLVTSDLRQLPIGEAKVALLLKPKGQFRALMAVAWEEKELRLFAPRGRGEELARFLEFYLRFSRVSVEAEGPAGLVWWLGEGETPGVPPLPSRSWAFRPSFWGISAWLWIGETSEGFPLGTEEQLERRRVVVGFPFWGKELVEDVLPPEVGWEEPYISYTKGCYVGQETMARLKSYGHTNRQLVRVVGPGEPPQGLPLELCQAPGGGPVGRLTSAVAGVGEGFWGLALVRRQVAGPGQELWSPHGPVRVVANFST